jgi:uncharacterized small protein (DUF1192 family)
MASLEDFKKAISETYEKQRDIIKKQGTERTAKMVSTAGRKSALGGITGPLSVAMTREAEKAGEGITSDALAGLGIAEAKSKEGIMLKEYEETKAQEMANQQLVSSVFSGVGSLIKGFLPASNFLPSK